MSEERVALAPVPCEPDIDDNGVERLAQVASFTNALLEIRALNEPRRSS